MNEDSYSNKMMSNINVTPFVDVMLVLLIIFMVTAPMMMQGVDVNLPETEAKPIKTGEDPLILTIDKKGRIFLETHTFELKGLETKIEKIFMHRREKHIILRADEEVPYGFVIKVIARIKKAGIDKIGMATKPLEQ